MSPTMSTANSIGDQLRMWRQRRRLISSSSRAMRTFPQAREFPGDLDVRQPSREMLLRLAERLAIPLRRALTHAPLRGASHPSIQSAAR